MKKLIYICFLATLTQYLFGSTFPRRVDYPNGSYSIQDALGQEHRFYLANNQRDLRLEIELNRTRIALLSQQINQLHPSSQQPKSE